MTPSSNCLQLESLNSGEFRTANWAIQINQINKQLLITFCILLCLMKSMMKVGDPVHSTIDIIGVLVLVLVAFLTNMLTYSPPTMIHESI